jgi:biofilm PGA synthesis N-glycosyltransferase PgaC
MRIVVIVPFLNEERYLPVMLRSMAAQTRPPDRLVLVDDGSSDRSPEIAASFADEQAYATVIRLPVRPRARDRLAGAPEWRAFLSGLAEGGGDHQVVAKMDADLELSPGALAEIERAFRDDPRLGMAGAYISALAADGTAVRQRCPSSHVEGSTKFYRRECYEHIAPVPAILGWDTIDEVRARMRGWRTASLAIPSGDPVHLRRMGTHDGLLRGYRRAGAAAHAYGAGPVGILLGALVRARARPVGVCGLHYVAGWALAALRRSPRAEPEARAFLRAEQRRRLLAGVRRGRP